MSKGMMYIPSLEEYAKIKKINAVGTVDSLSCDECRYCRASVNACIFGNQIRNLDYLDSCPRINKFLQN